MNGYKFFKFMGYNLFPINLLTLKPKIKTILTLIAGVFMLTGCVDEFKADLPTDATRVLVVNGNIQSGEVVTFTLSWSQSLNSSSKGGITYVTGAKVTVYGTDGSEYTFEEEKHSDFYYGERTTGRYTCALPQLNKDASYLVYIKIGNDVYQSTPQKPIPTPSIEDFSYFQRDSLSDIDFLVSTAEPEDPDKLSYYMWDCFETWEVRPRRTPSVYFDTEKMDVRYGIYFPQRGWKFGKNAEFLTESTAHYSGGKFTKHKIYGIRRDDERIFWNYCSMLTQRAMSKEEYEYHMAVRQAGWEMGGLFTPQPSAFPTNIHCTTSNKKVIGYVGCSLNTMAYTLYLDGTTISRELQKPYDTYKEENPSLQSCYEMVTQRHMLVYLWQDNSGGGGDLIVTWAVDKDIDIRLQEGLVTDKPPYMPPFGEE